MPKTTLFDVLSTSKRRPDQCPCVPNGRLTDSCNRLYGNPRSQIGGNVSRDFTRGYGPEEYCLHGAMKGMYTIQTNFFGSQSQTMAGAVTLQADVFTNYGRPNEKRRSITLRLTDRQETFTVAEIEY